MLFRWSQITMSQITVCTFLPHPLRCCARLHARVCMLQCGVLASSMVHKRNRKMVQTDVV